MPTVERFGWLAWPADGDSTDDSHEYPPDAVFREYIGISFTLLFVLLAIGAVVIDLVRVGHPDTGIPANYPLYLGGVYIIAVLFVLRRFHATFDNSRDELLAILERTEADSAMFERDSDVDADQINQEVNAVLSVAFSPIVIIGGGLVGGVFALGVMWAMDVFQYYPYLLLNYAYGAGHGFFYGPLLGSIYLLYRVTTAYIVDIDVLDPDGVGGYGDIGDAIITLIIYGIALVTLDFLILSSVTFVDEPLFQAAVFTMYAGMIVVLLGLALVGVLAIRRRLLAIRAHKTDRMRAEFKAIEERYWEKLDRGEPPDPEAGHIETMDTMFERLHNMALWPINLVSLSRLLASTGGSAIIALNRAGMVPLPV